MKDIIPVLDERLKWQDQLNRAYQIRREIIVSHLPFFIKNAKLTINQYIGDYLIDEDNFIEWYNKNQPYDLQLGCSNRGYYR